MAVDADAALQALLLPFAGGELDWPAQGGALFLHARDGAALHRQPLPGLVCASDWKPDVDALARGGWPLRTGAQADARFPLVLLLPPRQREYARASLVGALDAAAAGGIVVAAMPNDAGARSGEKDFAGLAGPLRSLSKHHCRVFWSEPMHGPADPALAAQWRAADAPRPIAGGRFLSRPGVFAWDRIDVASALLAAHLPSDLSGAGADLGCGYGYLAARLLERCRGISALDLYEADRRALELARGNLEGEATRAAIGFHWHDVAAGLPRQYDFIVTNPPFHAQGREERPDLGRAFIAAAAGALRDGGRLLLVANRHLPYEAVLAERFEQVRTLAQEQGFKVVEAVKRRAIR
ncbi:MAG: class I SAM-dependent methyltransferase [Luteimonas sp.]